VITLRRPPSQRLATLAVALTELDPSPPHEGKVRSLEETIGWGIKRFDRARLALRRLEQFKIPSTFVTPATHAAGGARTMVVGRRAGLWTVGPVEVVSYEEGETSVVCEIRTLAGHPLHGVERFELTRLPNGIVRLGIHAVSRPAVWWAWLGYPVVRWMQRSYRLDAVDHIRRVTGRRSGEA
jgi:uncharacterized protein (UPF0548 family)